MPFLLGGNLSPLTTPTAHVSRSDAWISDFVGSAPALFTVPSGLTTNFSKNLPLMPGCFLSDAS